MSEQQKIDVKVSDVLTFLKEGKTREEIAAHYGLTLAEAKRDIFSHEKIKNKKTHKPSKVALIDDTPEVALTDDTDSQESNLAATDLQEEQVVFNEEVVAENTSEMPVQEVPASGNAAGEEVPTTQAGTW